MALLPALLALGLFAGAPQAARAAVYANITEIIPTELTNGIQITVRSDGVLRWESSGAGYGSKIVVRFPGARSRVGKSFIDVGKFPVSGLMLVTPQDAFGGIGVEMTVTLFAPSSFSIRESEDQQSVLITVNSPRTIGRTRVGAADAGRGPATTSLDVHFEDDLLSVRAVRTNIHTLLGLIADRAGIEITVDDQVSNSASLNLERLPVDTVMRGIASAYGLALSQIDNVYMISKGVPDDLAAYRLSGTESFRMNYIQADTATGLLPHFLFQYVHRNSEQNAVVVTAPTQMLDKIRADLEKVDVPPPMIMVEALAVEVNSTRDLETALGARISDLSLEPTDDPKKPNPATGVQMDSATGEFAYRNIGNQRFIQVQFTQFGNQQTRIQAVDVGVKLEITPWTGGNGEITTRIEPEVSNIVELDPVSGLPVLSTRRARTSVRVRDGETIVIGGLRQRQDTILRRKVPVLGDIPLVGALFRSRMENRLDTELVIFITPRILTETGHLPDDAVEEDLRKRFLDELQ